MYKCKICGREFEKLKSLQSHFSQSHKITSKSYYDTYIKKDSEGVCYCGKLTNFKNITLGYHKYCCVKCQSNDPEIIKKRIEKVKGDNHWTRRLEGPNKGKTYEEIHGRKKAKELKDTLSIKGKELVGIKNPFYGKTHSYETKEILRNNRIGKTYEEIYGLEKSEKIKNKLRNKNENTWYRDYYTDYESDFFDKELRKKILIEQNFTCPICFKDIKRKFSKQLHHINYIKKDNRRENLIYLCVGCHSTTNRDRNLWKAYLKLINRDITKNEKLQRRLLHIIEKQFSLELRETIINRRRYANE